MTAGTVPMRVEAVIFDWGGTLTHWHDVDFHAESLALAQAVVNADHDPAEIARAAARAPATRSGAARATTSSSATVGRPVRRGRSRPRSRRCCTAYYDFWEPHTITDPEVRPLFEELRLGGHQGRGAVQHHLAA